ncbi:hypothetical protein LR48_Vigan118s001600 [Vigna angularis]|uniref:PB1-like domain-containing protein n=1 Tax=Phaseolus angularis TaxID=3914 RepID=A0A0L9T5F6_PHAAN|nr:hypothetical protein LR48_Vigan118s001600 [Vigna angularis]
MANCDVEVVFHHGGKFVNDGSFKYEFGQTSTLKIDPDRWSYFEIMSILKEMGYINIKELWYSVGGGTVLEGRLELLSDDKGACDLVNLAILNGQSHLYVVHMVSDPEYVHMLGEGDTDNRVEVECEEECEKAILGEEAEGEDGGHDDYDVRSWNEDEEDVLSEDHLVEVSVHGDEVEDDFCNRSEEVEVGGPSGKCPPLQHCQRLVTFEDSPPLKSCCRTRLSSLKTHRGRRLAAVGGFAALVVKLRKALPHSAVAELLPPSEVVRTLLLDREAKANHSPKTSLPLNQYLTSTHRLKYYSRCATARGRR